MLEATAAPTGRGRRGLVNRPAGRAEAAIRHLDGRESMKISSTRVHRGCIYAAETLTTDADEKKWSSNRKEKRKGTPGPEISHLSREFLTILPPFVQLYPSLAIRRPSQRTQGRAQAKGSVGKRSP